MNDGPSSSTWNTCQLALEQQQCLGTSVRRLKYHWISYLIVDLREGPQTSPQFVTSLVVQGHSTKTFTLLLSSHSRVLQKSRRKETVRSMHLFFFKSVLWSWQTEGSDPRVTEWNHTRAVPRDLVVPPVLDNVRSFSNNGIVITMLNSKRRRKAKEKKKRIARLQWHW